MTDIVGDFIQIDRARYNQLIFIIEQANASTYEYQVYVDVMLYLKFDPTPMWMENEQIITGAKSRLRTTPEEFMKKEVKQ